jgi:hypothetical protein
MLKRLDTKVNGTKISARYVNRETFVVSKNDRRLSAIMIKEVMTGVIASDRRP